MMRKTLCAALASLAVAALGCGAADSTSESESVGEAQQEAQQGGNWYYTCGSPVCNGYHPKPGVPLCTTEQPGDRCRPTGETCDPVSFCDNLLICATSDPTQQPGGCPISRRAYKTNINYLADRDAERLRDDLMRFRLATYQYTAQGPAAPEHLGFIIDDVEPSPSVNAGGDTVDLYGYTTMAVAALQAQGREIDELKREVAELKQLLQATRPGVAKKAPAKAAAPQR